MTSDFGSTCSKCANGYTLSLDKKSCYDNTSPSGLYSDPNCEDAYHKQPYCSICKVTESFTITGDCSTTGSHIGCLYFAGDGNCSFCVPGTFHNGTTCTATANTATESLESKFT